ncbi:VanZ family protein [Paenibacillus humicola]|uniref:VanZ family protein n=1 Tax=Paenibacillus humicola TaxID=3110540 RepID=UPI00237AD9E5|nr:VanZ family protein [Paenibacillus humicola]
MKKKLVEAAVQALFALYLYVLVKIILFKFAPVDLAFLRERLRRNMESPGWIAGRLEQGNFVPFREISRSYHAMSEHGLVNLYGNIAIFIPLGLFLGRMPAGKMTAAGALLSALGVSLGLECAQALLSIGSFDVDDLILNTGGGLLGFIAWRISVKINGTNAMIQGAGRRK